MAPDQIVPEGQTARLERRRSTKRNSLAYAAHVRETRSLIEAIHESDVAKHRRRPARWAGGR